MKKTDIIKNKTKKNIHLLICVKTHQKHRKDEPETRDYLQEGGEKGMERRKRGEEGMTLLSIPFHITLTS